MKELRMTKTEPPADPKPGSAYIEWKTGTVNAWNGESWLEIMKIPSLYELIVQLSSGISGGGVTLSPITMHQRVNIGNLVQCMMGMMYLANISIMARNSTHKEIEEFVSKSLSEMSETGRFIIETGEIPDWAKLSGFEGSMSVLQQKMLSSKHMPADIWTDDPRAPRVDWKAEVAFNDTTMGYHEWALNVINKSETNEDTEWKCFTRYANGPKLLWLERQLDAVGIKHRRNLCNTHAPILEVDKEKIEDAQSFLDPVDDIPDDSPQFTDNLDKLKLRTKFPKVRQALENKMKEIWKESFAEIHDLKYTQWVRNRLSTFLSRVGVILHKMTVSIEGEDLVVVVSLDGMKVPSIILHCSMKKPKEPRSTPVRRTEECKEHPSGKHRWLRGNRCVWCKKTKQDVDLSKR